MSIAKTLLETSFPTRTDGSYDHAPIGSVLGGLSKLPNEDFLFCDGSVLNISDYPELAEKLGKSHKVNESQFQLPTYQGRSVFGRRPVYDLIKAK